MSAPISEQAIQAIIGYEVTDQPTYERIYTRPTWPGGNSGGTIGIGDDLGMMTAGELRTAYTALDTATLGRLATCCGLTGQHANAKLTELRDITVPWPVAEAVFRDIDIPRYTARTIAAFPGCDQLGPDCLGALVSLVFNRGPGMTDPPSLPGQRREMRQIREAIANGQPALVPPLLRAMKRLWVGKNQDGLLARRDAEAAMFEHGLASPTG